MARRFADVPLRRWPTTVKIARRCNLTLVLGKPRLPNFPTPEGVTLDDYLVQLSERGAGKAPGIPVPERRANATPSATPISNACAGNARPSSRDGLSGLLPDRAGLHQLGQEQWRAGGAGPGLGRRFAGGLRVGHHRPRSHPLRPAVRTLPESGTGVHARLRYRFLPGQPRTRHRLRQGKVRPRGRQPDRYFRYARRQGRGARRRPRAGYAVHVLRRPLQAESFQSG